MCYARGAIDAEVEVFKGKGPHSMIMQEESRDAKIVVLGILLSLVLCMIPFPLSEVVEYSFEGTYVDKFETGGQIDRHVTIWIEIDANRTILVEFVWYYQFVTDNRLVLASFTGTKIRYNCTRQFLVEIKLDEPTWIHFRSWYIYEDVDSIFGRTLN
ncbi:MAG: hypothetical protein ACFE7R_10560 [Candidatus Hodarchaeota archaeon]